ncbi:hypothetical protein ACFL2Q_15290, partial [Thermodesulfobacteriota bacterium]
STCWGWPGFCEGHWVTSVKFSDRLSHVVQVVESHGCNAQHKVGDKFLMDAAGTLLSKQCPERMCILALSSLGS